MTQLEPRPPVAMVAPLDELCPLRPGDGCKLCVPGATGPGNCGLVYLVTSDPSLREQLSRTWSDLTPPEAPTPGGG